MSAPELIPSGRITSNSRGPGQKGTVYVRRGELTRCEACGTLRYGAGPHAPRWSEGRLVDCAGNPVRCSARSPAGLQCRLESGHTGHHLARAEVAHG